MNDIKNNRITVDYYEKGNIYTYIYLKENKDNKSLLDVYNSNEVLIGTLKKENSELYQVKYIDNKYLFLDKFNEYISKSYSLQDILTSCFYDIENGERGCDNCKRKTLSYICIYILLFIFI